MINLTYTASTLFLKEIFQKIRLLPPPQRSNHQEVKMNGAPKRIAGAPKRIADAPKRIADAPKRIAVAPNRIVVAP
jgi:hypothetical protein